MYSSEDEDLARFDCTLLDSIVKKNSFISRAIAPTASRKPESVDLISDDDEHDTSSVTEQSSKSILSTFLSERAQLEKERRERQKRLRSQAGLPNSDDERPAKRHHLFSSSVRSRADRSSSSTVPSDSARQSPATPLVVLPDGEELFFEGELRQTATQHGEPRRDGRPTFRLTQILGKVLNQVFCPDLKIPNILSFLEI